MSYVDKKLKELRELGIYSAGRVNSDVIHKIVNMEEWEYYDIDVGTLESYLGLLAQQVLLLQQECNIADAREIELGNDFKIHALPEVIGAKIRSVEERWIFASTLSPELQDKFNLWQKSIIDATLKKKLAEPITEKINVLKKIYDDRRLEGKNKNYHKYTDGS
jgi:hypothetical protein